MSRRLSIVCTMIIFAFVSAASGCSSASSPSVVSHSGAAGIQKSPQSLGSWTTKAPMPTARDGLAAGVINGILYAVGGDNRFEYNTNEAYDPATDTWTAKASMPQKRNLLAVGAINGILYAVGGNNIRKATKTLYAYDPTTNTWTTKAPMPTARLSLGASVLGGKLYAVGGLETNNAYSNRLEAYDPVTNTWTTKAAMPTAREGLATRVLNGILYAVGGDNHGVLNTVEAYNPR